MSSSHGRSSSHAPSRPSTSHRLTSQHKDQQADYEQNRQSLQSSHDVPPVSRKRRSDHGLSEDAKRRRHDGGVLTADELLKPSIVVRAHPPNHLSRPWTLLPLMLLPREHLSLSCLDLTAPHGDLPSSRKFHSDIRILELEGRLGSNVLIARSPSSSTGSSGGFSNASSIFAIERDGAGLYVLCKLGSWVDVRGLEAFATAVCQQRMPASLGGTANTTEPALITPQVYKEQGKKRLAIAELQSIVRRRPASQPVAETLTAASHGDEAQSAVDALADATTTQTHTENPSSKDLASELPDRPPNQILPYDKTITSTQLALPTPPASDATKVSPPPLMDALEPAGPPTAGDIFQNIRNQYCEALYHSMGSLAYFAKGPLSRARAAFHLDCDSNLEMDDLIGFLKSLVLATAVIDKKYRETVPEIVARLRTLGNLSDHAEPQKKSRKSKKTKLGSNGLYPDEAVHIQKWWDANKPAPRDDEVFPRPEEVKYTISCLRTRETQLQIILILEILALETMRPTGDAGESQLPGETASTKKEAPKKRSKHNFPLLIDVHADRLCIWQSTVSDDVRAMAESQVRSNGDVGASQMGHSDSLKEFCVDIVVPFFSPRLPLICDSLNRKLGGPVIAAPGSRSKTATSSTRSPADAKTREKSSATKLQQQSKPGTAARRLATSTNSARSLERVLSNERLRRSVSRGPNDAIAQMRSATAAPIPGLKREMSEPAPLASIPRRASSTSLKERPTKTLARSSSDASTGDNGRHDDPRAHKKALVEAELQKAISALKKPNRELAGKASVEAAEKRLFGVSGQPRKPKKQSRTSAPSDRVQVKATPVSSRFRDVFASNTAGSQGLFGREDAGGHGGFSQHHQDHAGPPVNRELLFAARSQQQAFNATSPKVVASPLAGRIQATPVRMSTSVPDSAIKVAAASSTAANMTMATTTSTTTTTMTSNFSIARSSFTLQSFPEEGEESVPMSSPVAPRRAPPTTSTQAASYSKFELGGGNGAGMRAIRRPDENHTPLESDMIPASSPLQARSQPSMNVVTEGAAMFETPTKVRTLLREDSIAKRSVLATPVAGRPATIAPAGGGGNSVQSLYQQMGWDDDLDDLA